MLSKIRKVVGLDIGSRFVKAIELSEGREGYHVTAFGAAEVENPSALAETTQGVFKKGNFGTRRVVIGVSGRSVIVRYISMLKMPDEDLRNAIRYEADKYIPFEVEEVVIDYQRLEDESEARPPESGSRDEMRVLLVAVKRTLIEEHVAMLRSIGLIPHIIDVDSFALGNAFEFRTFFGPHAEDRTKVLALVDVDANKSNVNILQGTSSYFTREIYLAGNDFTDAVAKRTGLDPQRAELLKRNPGERVEEVRELIAPVMENLTNEIRLSIDYFENQFDKRVEEIFVSGGSSRLPGMNAYIESALKRKTSSWDPLEHLTVDSSLVDANALAAMAPQLAVACGLASRIRKD